MIPRLAFVLSVIGFVSCITIDQERKLNSPFQQRLDSFKLPIQKKLETFHSSLSHVATVATASVAQISKSTNLDKQTAGFHLDPAHVALGASLSFLGVGAAVGCAPQVS